MIQHNSTSCALSIAGERPTHEKLLRFKSIRGQRSCRPLNFPHVFKQHRLFQIFFFSPAKKSQQLWDVTCCSSRRKVATSAEPLAPCSPPAIAFGDRGRLFLDLAALLSGLKEPAGIEQAEVLPWSWNRYDDVYPSTGSVSWQCLESIRIIFRLMKGQSSQPHPAPPPARFHRGSLRGGRAFFNPVAEHLIPCIRR